MCKHASRSTYHTTFLKCNDRNCPHCSKYPVKAVEAVQFLRSAGGHLPVPTFIKLNAGHYRTFLETCTHLSLGKELPDLHAGLPSSERPSRCSNGCSYVFMSARDENRHVRLVHPSHWKAHRQVMGKNAAEVSAARPTTESEGLSAATPAKRVCYRCTFSGCGIAFANNYQL